MVLHKKFMIMALIKFNPGFENSFPGVLDSFFNDSFGGLPQQRYTAPAVNIQEDEEGFIVELAVPGLKKEDFKVEMDNKLLKISGEKKDEKEEKREKYSRKEFSYQSFQRSFTLPDTVDEAKIRANYQEGVLTLQIPKKEEAKAKPARTIEIG